MEEDEGAHGGAGAREGGQRRAQRAAAARRPTMIDVANEARVSQTTVSLVLNHADGARLSQETRERVIRAAARLGYQPGRRISPSAAASAASIGFVCDEISTDPWTAIGLDGVREKAWEHGLTVTVMVTRAIRRWRRRLSRNSPPSRCSASSMRPSTPASLKRLLLSSSG